MERVQKGDFLGLGCPIYTHDDGWRYWSTGSFVWRWKEGKRSPVEFKQVGTTVWRVYGIADDLKHVLPYTFGFEIGWRTGRGMEAFDATQG